ncbi:MAG TPA: YdcF family protein [Allosphingosinicella sp.]|nr:YdcF family protein [Allosphingosinicella sp.]
MIRWFFRLFALALLLYALGYAAFAVLLPRPAGDERTDAIVVLTGGTGRLERGFALMKAGRASRMLISGVPSTARPEDYLERHEVDPAMFECCIVLGKDSFDTRSNADEVARWVGRRGYRSIRLVTNDYHMPRALYQVRKQVGEGVDVLPDAVPAPERAFEQIFIEYNKFLLDRTGDLIGI